MLLIKALFAAAIPFVVMAMIGLGLLAMGNATEGRSAISIGVVIAAVSGGRLIYRIPGWSLTKRSVVHFLLMLVAVLPALWFTDWLPLHGVGDVLLFFAIGLAVAALLWGVTYLVFTKIVHPRAERNRNPEES